MTSYLGYARVQQVLADNEMSTLSSVLAEVPSNAGGKRWAGRDLASLLQSLPMHSLVREISALLPDSVVLRIVAFKKDAGANWFVPAHQDRSIPIPSATLPPGFSRATRKGDGWQAEAPIEVLQAMRNVRVFIDNATEDDGPLEVIPGSHRLGRIEQADIPGFGAGSDWHPLTGKAGEVAVLSPLLLHRSARAATPLGRRVLQLECIATEVAERFGLI